MLLTSAVALLKKTWLETVNAAILGLIFILPPRAVNFIIFIRILEHQLIFFFHILSASAECSYGINLIILL